MTRAVRSLALFLLAIGTVVIEAAAGDEVDSTRTVEVAVTATAERPSSTWVGTRAADEAVRATLDAHGADRSVERPGVGTYLRDLGVAASRTLAAWFSHLVPGFERVGQWFGGLGAGWLWLAVVLVAGALAIRSLRAWWLGRGRPAETAVVQTRPAPETAVVHDDLDRTIEGADVPAALEALWWWLARRLEAHAVGASWTSRELVTRAGRADLLPLVRRLDAYLYGPEPPDRSAVRGLWHDLRGTLG